jgi:hypothetical protein
MLVDHATLGANATTDSSGRVLVEQILTTSDAYRQGLRPGDEIVAFAGRSIGSSNQLKNLLGVYPRGWRIELTYRRDKETTVIRPQLEGVHRPGELAQKAQRLATAAQKPLSQSLPSEVRKLYEAKPGFANYYFNRTKSDELLSWLGGLATHHSPLAAPWRLHAETATKQSVRIIIADAVSAWEEGTTRYAYQPGDEERAEPPGTGGLLLALDQWRRLLREGRAGFGRCDFGGATVGESGQKLLVLETERGSAECRWLFDPGLKELRGLECRPSRDRGSCDVVLSDYRLVGVRRMPHRWEVRFNGRVVMQFAVRYTEPLE